MMKLLAGMPNQLAKHNDRSIIEMTINQEVLLYELQKRKGRSSP
jgi:hypothetical protein